MDSKGELVTDSEHVEVAESLEKKAKPEASELSKECDAGSDDLYDSDDARDDAFYNDGLHHMTASEYSRYVRQITDSDGFDVDDFPDVFAFGIVQPAPLCCDHVARIATKFGKMAVEDYNKKIEKEGGVMLEFVKPLKINRQGVAGFKYFLTFEAKDVGVPDDESRIYQSLVYDGINVIEVLIFRLKATGTLSGN